MHAIAKAIVLIAASGQAAVKTADTHYLLFLHSAINH
jgi:hypothetical protein